MTTRNVMINSEAFSEDISNFETHVNNIVEYFEKISRTMSNIDGKNDLWKSNTAVLMHDDYQELEKRFEKINVELLAFVIFLKDTLSNYEIEESNIDKAIDENSSILDVNE